MTAKKKVKSKQNRPKSKLLPFLLIFILVSFTGACVVLYAGYKYYTSDLPDLRVITGYKPDLISSVYSSNGTLIGEFAAERRKIIDIDNIPPHVRNAFIAVEDRRFYEHEGVDIKSIVAAMMENIQEGDWVRGASTITQQVIKNVLLTPERTISRKIKEAILAYRIENNLSKEEILYLYLNHIYLADGTYGVEVASENYYGKRAMDLNIAESALLAGLPKKPEYYSPRKHLDRALQRQKLVLELMEEGGFITAEQRREAEEFEIEIIPKRRVNGKLAPYFVEHVRRYLEDKVGTEEFLKGGFTIFTTLDVNLNLEAQWALKRGVLDLESRQGRKVVTKHLNGKQNIAKWREGRDAGDLTEGRLYEAVVLSVKPLKSESESGERENNSDKTVNKGDDKQDKIAEREKKNGEKEPRIFTAEIAIGGENGILKYAVSSPFGSPVDGAQSPYTDKYVPSDGYEDLSVSPVGLEVGDVIRVKAENINAEKGINTFSLHIAPETQAALVSMNTDGNVLALTGGFDYLQSQFNRTTQAVRQPGSAFKPILYSSALDKGFTETSILYDMPVVIKDWAPQNYDGTYAGAITLRQALSKSRNLASVRLIQDVGPSYVANYAKNFGFETEFKPYPSLALGGADVKVIEMARAYNVFASGGKLVEPVFILRIYDRYGRIIEDNTGGKFTSKEESLKAKRQEERLRIIRELAQKKGENLDYKTEYLKEEEYASPAKASEQDSLSEIEYSFFTPDEFLELLKSEAFEFESDRESKQAISPETAYVMTDLLQAVVNEGTGRRAARLTSISPVAGKTGTTNDYTDAWFVGFSPSITTAVWVGRDDHKPIGRKEAGSRAALPIWIDYMEDALAKYPGGSFERPAGIQIVGTPYGSIPYSTESLRRNVLDELRRSTITIDETGFEMPSDSYYRDRGYGQNKDYRPKSGSDTETEIDFLLRR